MHRACTYTLSRIGSLESGLEAEASSKRIDRQRYQRYQRGPKRRHACHTRPVQRKLS